MNHELDLEELRILANKLRHLVYFITNFSKDIK